MAQRSILEIAVAVILDETGKMLLVRKIGTEAFMQPGGKIEAGETALQSLHREIREELGVEVKIAEYMMQASAPAANEPNHIVDAKVFRVGLSSTPEISAEIEEMCWYADEESDGRVLAPLSRQLLKEIRKVHPKAF